MTTQESYWEKKADTYMSGQGGRDEVVTTPTRRLEPDNTPLLAIGEGSNPSPAHSDEIDSFSDDPDEDVFDADDSFTGHYLSAGMLEDYEEEEF